MSQERMLMLLTLIAPPDLTHELVDWLLERGVAGYFTYRGSGHSAESAGMSLAEQVAGRRNKEVFQIQCDADELGELIAALKDEFTGAGLHYWSVPVHSAGRI